MLPEATINLNGKKSYDFDIQANQLSDILCRGATVSSVQSTNNTLTRNSTLRDTGDYDVPHPHPYTHHYMTTSTSATPQAMSIVGSSPQGSSNIFFIRNTPYIYRDYEMIFVVVHVVVTTVVITVVICVLFFSEKRYIYIHGEKLIIF